MTSPAPQIAGPQITVIVAVHNVEAHLAACLTSIAQQEFTDFEALIIDDGSHDGSRAVAQATIGEDPRFRILSYDNAGLSAARNRGLDLAQGDFIAFVDGDDRIAPGYLARMHAALVADGGDWVACGLHYVSPEGTPGPPHPALHGELPAPVPTPAPAPVPEPAPPESLPPVLPPPERHDLRNWCEVIRHFPSAWNKLYRRSLIGDLRFDLGTYYEDHAFFWQLARRCDHLLRLPDALYLQTQGREGQITRDGSDRVFQQFDVLEKLAQIVAQSPNRQGSDIAFARITSRLVFERSLAIDDAGRRARFIARARAFMADHAIGWTPHWDPGIGRGLGVSLAGDLPLTVIVPSSGTAEALRVTLRALAKQGLRDFETLIVVDGDDEDARLIAIKEARALPRSSVLIASALPASALPTTALTRADIDPGLNPDITPDMASRTARARNRGLEAAAGKFVVFLDAGDQPHPHALGQWLDAMLRHGPQIGGPQIGGPQGGVITDIGADMGFFPFLPGPNSPPHSGLHDSDGLQDRLISGRFDMDGETALRLHPLPSAKMFRRAFLNETGLRFASHWLQSWQFTLETALLARAVVHVPIAGVTLDAAPGHRHFWSPPLSAARLTAALDAVILATSIAADIGDHPLPPGWERRLFARAIWEKVNFALHPNARAAETYIETFSAAMQDALGQRDLRGTRPDQRLDPYIGPRIQKILQG